MAPAQDKGTIASGMGPNQRQSHGWHRSATYSKWWEWSSAALLALIGGDKDDGLIKEIIVWGNKKERSKQQKLRYNNLPLK